MFNKIYKGYNTANQISDFLNKFSSTSNHQLAQQANEIIKTHVGLAASAGLIPLPGIDMAAITAVQLSMLRQLAKLYNVNFFDGIGKNIIAALVGSSIARFGASLIKAIPLVGTILGDITMAVLSASSTFALGSVFQNHLENGGTMENFNIDAVKRTYNEEFVKGKDALQKNMASTPNTTTSNTDKTDKITEQLARIGELHAAGVLSDEEFQQMKTKIING